jgi:catechol 2,3-dioxygenase-like lactoylglutathione lyase family enzyme
MAAFFAGMFGAEVAPDTDPTGRAHPDRARFILRLGGQLLLVAPPHPDFPAASAPDFPHLGLEHIGLGVDDLDAAVAALRAKGADIPIGPLAGGPGFRLAFVRGPEGVMVELLQRP